MPCDRRQQRLCSLMYYKIYNHPLCGGFYLFIYFWAFSRPHPAQANAIIARQSMPAGNALYITKCCLLWLEQSAPALRGKGRDSFIQMARGRWSYLPNIMQPYVRTWAYQFQDRAWCLRLFLIALFLVSFVTYYCSHAFLQSYGGTSKSPNSSKSLCGGWLTQKKWESLNFNISRQTKLFLKLEDFFWREHLSKLALPYGIKGSELLLLKVLAIIANSKMPANIENLDCRTCVVIGNGFAIKNSSLGNVINKYDMVIRLNDAPVKGYEEDVGNKTTMRMFYPESASYNPSLHNHPSTLMVLVPFKQQDLRWLKEILYDEKRVRKGFWRPPPQIWLGETKNIRVLDPHFIHQTADRLLQIPLAPKNKQIPAHPTTGILAVFVALNYCDVVHIAGFGYPVANNQKHPIHYYGYDTMKSMKDSYHDLNQEADALKRLEDLGAIFYLHPHT